MVNYLSADDFEKLIQEKAVHILDVREPYEFSQGFIAEAKLVPTTCFWDEFKKLKIKKSDKIALYCRSGNRSHFIAQRLAEKGYRQIYNLELGIIDWVAQNKPLIMPKKIKNQDGKNAFFFSTP
jgi:rhodanese-related sulfurtransferase